LVKKLNELGIRACGAVNLKRLNLPRCPLIELDGKKKEDRNSPLSKYKMKRMKSGDYFQYYSGNITYLVIKDKTLMKLLYNHIPGSSSLIRKMSNNEEKIVPLALHHYCTYARGVDVVNQLHYNYIIGRKSRRCWPRLVWWLLELCILNAFYLWKKHKEGKSHKKFRLLLIKQIFATYNSNVIISSINSSIMHSNTNEHQLAHSANRGDCSVCSSRSSKRVTTSFKCFSCNQFVCASYCYDFHRTIVICFQM